MNEADSSQKLVGVDCTPGYDLRTSEANDIPQGNPQQAPQFTALMVRLPGRYGAVGAAVDHWVIPMSLWQP